MKWRSVVISLLLLTVFSGFAFYYFRFFVSPKTHAVILLITPGADLELLAASEIDAASILRYRTLFSPRFTALVRSRTTKGTTVDLPALMTSLSSGVYGPPGQLGLSKEGLPLDTLLYYAQRRGRFVGIVSDDTLTTPELASFYSTVTDPSDRGTIATHLIDSAKMSIILGDNDDSFTQAQHFKNRDLISDMRLEGRNLLFTRQDLQDFASYNLRSRIFGLFPFHAPNPVAAVTPTLPFMIQRSIQKLQLDPYGYFLVANTHILDRHPEDDTPEHRLDSLGILDDTIHTALEYAGKNSIVVLYSPYSRGRFTSSHSDSADPVLHAESTGWVFIYSQEAPSLGGFIWPSDLHNYLESKL